MATRAALDVSHLPENAFDARAPLWWGNLLLILIETTTILLLLTSYYYIRRNYEMWPPTRPDPLPSMIDTAPDLTPGTWNTALLVVSCLPMYLTDIAACKKRRWLATIGLALMLLISGISTWLRFEEFPSIHFNWADNAYASVVWTMLGIHLTYILAGGVEFLIMLLWMVVHEIDDKHALDVTLAGGYWYWVAGIWLLVYATVYLSPHFL